MKTIWVTGGKGQLGVSLQQAAKAYPDTNFLFTDVDELDITQSEAVESFMEKHRPQVIINGAAYTQVDQAETNHELAKAVNASAVEVIAKLANVHHALLLQVSTDFVFDGNQGRPYVESDTTHPLSVYGATKLQGEEAAVQFNPKTIVVRTAWVYAEHGKNFLQTMLRLGKERDLLKVVSDQVGTPTYTGDLAEVLLTIAHDSALANKYGIYHYTHEGVASWYDFACAIMEMASLDCRVEPIPTSAYPTPATRPHYSYLSKEKIKETFGLTIPYWRTRLQEVIKKTKD